MCSNFSSFLYCRHSFILVNDLVLPSRAQIIHVESPYSRTRNPALKCLERVWRETHLLSVWGYLPSRCSLCWRKELLGWHDLIFPFRFISLSFIYLLFYKIIRFFLEYHGLPFRNWVTKAFAIYLSQTTYRPQYVQGHHYTGVSPLVSLDLSSWSVRSALSLKSSFQVFNFAWKVFEPWKSQKRSVNYT